MHSSRLTNCKKLLKSQQECLIIGNGPSFEYSLINKEIFIGRDIYCVNYFAFSEHFIQIKPTYYVLVDPTFWIKEAPEDMVEQNIKLFDKILNIVEWNLNFLVPGEMKKSPEFLDFIRKSKNKKNINIIYFNRTPVVGFEYFRYFIYKLRLGMIPPYNVMVAVLFLAVKSGYSNIYIIGADHSWHRDIKVGSDRILYIKEAHSYSLDNNTYRVFDKGRIGEIYKIHEVFLGWGKLFESYNHINDFATAEGVKIYNYTQNSFIDAFEFVSQNNND